MRWLSIVVLAACSAPYTPPHPETGITYQFPAQTIAPGPDVAKANRILVAYANEHAFGAPRGAPTDAELAAAADADPVDGVAPADWHGMDPPTRLMHAYLAGQHAAWDAKCYPGVETWWHAAKAIDDELAARLAVPPPADITTGLAVWSGHRLWLKQRMQGDAAVNSLPLSGIGAYNRLVTAQLAWAEGWSDRPVEHALAVAAIMNDGWPLESLGEEQARFCGNYSHSDQRWPPTFATSPRIQQPRNPHLPKEEYGVVRKVDATGGELRVTRRDLETTLVFVPPCKVVECKGIDCGMTPMGRWQKICTEKKVQRFVDSAWTLHIAAPAIVPKVGDHVWFYFDDAGNAVLASAGKTEAGDPYFKLAVY